MRLPCNAVFKSYAKKKNSEEEFHDNSQKIYSKYQDLKYKYEESTCDAITKAKHRVMLYSSSDKKQALLQEIKRMRSEYCE